MTKLDKELWRQCALARKYGDLVLTGSFLIRRQALLEARSMADPYLRS